MAELHHLRLPDAGKAKGQSPEHQLLLPFDTENCAGNLVCVFEREIQPETISNIIIREGVGCLADLRRVPFFAGDGHRHKRINNLLADYGIPVFHVGSAYFSAIDQNLPASVKISKISNLLEHSDRVRQTVAAYLGRGAGLLILDEDPDVIALAKMVVTLISSKFENTQIKLNKAWSRVSRTSGVPRAQY